MSHSSFSAHPATFVATLGGQPQVVTFALDLLLARGIRINEVIVVHLAPRDERQERALERLNREFSNGRYAGHACRYEHKIPQIGTHAIRDITNDAQAQAVLQTIRQIVIELKERQRTIHFCVAGGRRGMGILAMSVAPLHFDHQDTLWHLYSPDSVKERTREGVLMHVDLNTIPSYEKPRLIKIPTVPWGEYLPALRALGHINPDKLLQAPLSEEERCRCHQVVKGLTPRPLQVLRAFAAGHTPNEVATQLHLSKTTVSSYSTRIYKLCRQAWPEENGRINYRFLAVKFRPYFEQEHRR